MERIVGTSSGQRLQETIDPNETVLLTKSKKDILLEVLINLIKLLPDVEWQNTRMNRSNIYGETHEKWRYEIK